MNIDMSIVVLVAGAILAAIGWQFKKHDDRISSSESDVESVKLHIANDYVKKVDAERLERAIKTDAERLEHAMFAKLDRIENKQDGLFIELSKKVDRT